MRAAKKVAMGKQVASGMTTKTTPLLQLLKILVLDVMAMVVQHATARKEASITPNHFNTPPNNIL